MGKILQGVAVVVALTLAGPAPAGWHYSYHYSYHVTNGVRFSHGYYFAGPGYRQFTYRYWSPRFGAYAYWYPGTRTWYYWSGPRAVYYPLSYAVVVPPGGAAPAGADSLPSALPTDIPPPVLR
jgi:hypothetical protein